jgi:antitoxin HicB
MMLNVNDYMALPYTIELIREDATTWFARVVELPGCMTEGDSAAEAVAMLQDAMAGWIELALEDGRSIPAPKRQEEFSGKFVVRVPKSLHRDLVAAAAKGTGQFESIHRDGIGARCRTPIGAGDAHGSCLAQYHAATNAGTSDHARRKFGISNRNRFC